MGQYHFEVEKIVSFLARYKDDLPELYTWNVNLSKLIDLEVLTQTECYDLEQHIAYERELLIKKKVGSKLKTYYENDKKSFEALCLWVVKDWGGIKTAKDTNTTTLIEEFLSTDLPEFKRIASSSKVGAFMYPEKNIIYDSRVAYALNWIILSQNAGDKFFPIPSGRNSKMMAFDLNELIRLHNVSEYSVQSSTELGKKKFISQRDKKFYIDEKDAYGELNKLIGEISRLLWNEKELQTNLYHTEMLLFAIADTRIYMDITNRVSFNID
jgi:hypothetical protein